jgi:beta-xylosidase
MKNKMLVTVFLLLIFFTVTPGFADNPIIQNIYTADPAPLVYNGTVYLYTGHDENAATNSYLMRDYRCYSSTDMVNWTDHGVVLDVTAFSWASQTDNANAAQVIYRNGTFYYYVSVAASGGIAIGIAVSNSPTGPFTDALGHALITNDMTTYADHSWDNLDPTVFIDDDGQAYLYWGNNACYWVRLNNDMISFSGSITAIPLNTATFGPDFEEAPWLYKRNGLYYLVFAAGFPEWIAYSTSFSPTGPWTYRGVIMPRQGNSSTIHPGVIDFNGGFFFFYHNDALPGGDSYHRSVCIEEFTYNADGTFPTINMTTTGVIIGRTPEPTPTGSLGNVNGDGSINIVDALLIAQYYVNLNPSPFIPGNADTNCDGDINIIDALLVAQYYVDLITEFC